MTEEGYWNEEEFNNESKDDPWGDYDEEYNEEYYDDWVPTIPKAKLHFIEEDYSVLTVLGEGAFSIVKKGKSKKNGKEVALKFIDKWSDDLEKLIVEIMLMEEVHDSKSVVNLIDVYETYDELILVLELVVGGELFDKIAEKGAYSESDASHALQHILTGLNDMHQKNIIHRDLKPENLLCVSPSLDVLDDIKIADLGEGIKLDESGVTTGLRGSPSYIAPEVYLNQEYGVKADLWSVGVIAYILLCGYLPFEEPFPEDIEDSDDYVDLKELIISGEFEFHEDSWGDVCDHAKDLISKLLDKNVETRLTAEQALQHPFISGDVASKEIMSKAVSNLKRFNAYRHWQRAIVYLMAANKLKSISSGNKKKKRRKRRKARREITKRGVNLDTCEILRFFGRNEKVYAMVSEGNGNTSKVSLEEFHLPGSISRFIAKEFIDAKGKVDTPKKKKVSNSEDESKKRSRKRHSTGIHSKRDRKKPSPVSPSRRPKSVKRSRTKISPENKREKRMVRRKSQHIRSSSSLSKKKKARSNTLSSKSKSSKVSARDIFE
eukprot:TRINITY_DN9187_c0_g1_i1.p1 TRINITY_DN9187_c0_g1~~TRINITY_DN9187_c0_g1_i1.p1  ORF type:complete len:548 (+),score=140.67 TRINITY_DN9187_c0_g1_i1:25-1668(+)